MTSCLGYLIAACAAILALSTCAFLLHHLSAFLILLL